MAAKRLLDTPEKLRNEPPKKAAAVREADKGNLPGANGGERGGPPLDQVEAAPEWFNTFLLKFYKLEERIDTKLINRLDEIAQRSIDNTSKIEACSIHIDSLAESLAKLKTKNNELSAKLDELENRSRRMNLVLHNIPEKKKENCEETVKDFFRGFVGVTDVSIERCHRTPTVLHGGSPPTKPRIIHVAFGSFAMKEKIRKATIVKLREGALFEGKKVAVSEDFSQRVQHARKEKRGDLMKLKNEGKKPFFLYPAKLAYRNKEGKLIIV